MLRLTRWIVFSLLILTLLPAALPAQPAGMTVETKAGFDGYYRPGAWVPVFVTIANQPAQGQTIADLSEFAGQLMMITAPGGDTLAVRYGREIQVPPSSKKQYTLYAKLPTKVGAAPELLLNSANGKREATYKLDLNAMNEKSLLVVNVSESLSRPGLPQINNGPDRLLFSKIPPNELPDHWAAWDSADVVVLDGWPAAGMSMEASQALHDWVAMGGTLAMLGGINTNSYNEALAKEMLPVELTATASMQETGSGFRVVRDAAPQDSKLPTYLIGLPTLKPGSKTLLEIDSVPMVVSQPVGKGRIVYVAADFKSASRTLERAFLPAWLAVMPQPNGADPSHEFMDSLNEFKSLTGRAAKAPNSLLIILICVIYMVVVGPLNFGILSKKKKLEWAWFTVPAIVLFFFFMIYGFGRFTKGNASLYYELSLENYYEGSPDGASMTVGSSFVSSSGNHLLRPVSPRHVLADPFRWEDEFDFRDPTFSQVANAVGLGGGGTALPLSGTPPLVQYDTEKAQIFVRNWEMSTFDARSYFGGGPVQMTGGITSDFSWNGSRLTGTIKNGSDRNFDECYLMFGTTVYPLNKLSASDTQDLGTINLPFSGSPVQGKWTNGSQHFSNKIVGAVDDSLAVSENNFGLTMSRLLAPHLTGKLFPPNSGRFYFVGFQRSAGDPSTITSIAMTDKHRAVATIVELNVPAPKGEFVLPANAVPMQLLDWDKDTAGYVHFQEDGTLFMVDGYLMACAELPFRDGNTAVTQFQIVCDSTVPTSQDLVVEVFSLDPVRTGWTKVPTNQWLDNRGIALPVSGKMYFRMTSRKPATPPTNGNGSWGEKTEIRALGVSFRGNTP